MLGSHKKSVVESQIKRSSAYLSSTLVSLLLFACVEQETFDIFAQEEALLFYDLTERAGSNPRPLDAPLAEGALLSLEVRHPHRDLEGLLWASIEDDDVARITNLSQRRIKLEALQPGTTWLSVETACGSSGRIEIGVEPVGSIGVRPDPFQRYFPDSLNPGYLETIRMVRNTRFPFLLEYRGVDGNVLTGYGSGLQLLGSSDTRLQTHPQSNFASLQSGTVIERLSLVTHALGGVNAQVLDDESVVGLIAIDVFREGRLLSDGELVRMTRGESVSLYLMGLTASGEAVIIDGDFRLYYDHPDRDVALYDSSDTHLPLLTLKASAMGSQSFRVEWGDAALHLGLEVR